MAKLKRAVVKQALPGSMAAKAQGYKQMALCWPLPAGYTLKLPASHEGPSGQYTKQGRLEATEYWSEACKRQAQKGL